MNHWDANEVSTRHIAANAEAGDVVHQTGEHDDLLDLLEERSLSLDHPAIKIAYVVKVYDLNDFHGSLQEMLEEVGSLDGFIDHNGYRYKLPAPTPSQVKSDLEALEGREFEVKSMKGVVKFVSDDVVVSWNPFFAFFSTNNSKYLEVHHRWHRRKK